MELSKQHRSHRPRRRSGFTLVEIMVVIVIIVLMLGMAIPVLHVITGSQSEAGAANMIAAQLSRARTDAIGLQRPIGVAFIYNPNTQVQTMAEVEFPPTPEWTSGTPVTTGSYVKRTAGTLSYYFINTQTGTTTTSRQPPLAQTTSGTWQAIYGPPIELRPDTDLQPLPAGIAVQTVCNCSITTSNGASQRTSDGYLSVGVIFFDGQGRLTAQPYGIAAASLLSTSSGLNQAYPSAQNVGVLNANGSTNQFGVLSQFGLVVFQRNAFAGQGFPAVDPTYNTPTASLSGAYGSTANSSQPKGAEDLWVDQNSTPLLINRYTGTLIKGE